MSSKLIDELYSRLDYCLEWYKGCDVCQETLDNVRADVNSVFEEFERNNKLTLPFTLKVTFEDDLIVLKPLDRKLN